MDDLSPAVGDTFEYFSLSLPYVFFGIPGIVWPALMGFIALWCWFKTKIRAALIVGIGFLIGTLPSVAKYFIPVRYGEYIAGDTVDAVQFSEASNAGLHMIIGVVGLAGFLTALIGFLLLCVHLINQRSMP